MEAAQSLQQLQDAVPPFSTEVALSILGEELGAPAAQLFAELSPQPVASASLGQVYRGRLAANGMQVAVKVQRPGLEGALLLDLYLLRLVLAVVRKLAVIRQDITRLADELASGLLQELDYTGEGANSEAFAQAHRALGFVTVPAVRWELTTRRILTTEWVEGASPVALLAKARSLPVHATVPEAAAADANSADEAAALPAADVPVSTPADPQAAAASGQLLHLVDMGIEASLSQLLETGVLHGDPHPGNILLTTDGWLAYLDFGLLATVPRHAREAMLAALVHLARSDWRRLAGDLAALRILKPTTDLGLLAQDLQRELQPPTVSTSSAAERQLLTASAALGFSGLAGVIFKLALRHRFELPPYYVLIVRSCTLLEGIALAADPQYLVVTAAVPVIARRLLGDQRAASRRLLAELVVDGEGGVQLPGLQELLDLYQRSLQQARARLSTDALKVVLLQHTCARVVAAQLCSADAVALRAAVARALALRVRQWFSGVLAAAKGGAGTTSFKGSRARRGKAATHCTQRQQRLLRLRAMRYAWDAGWRGIWLVGVVLWSTFRTLLGLA